MEKKKKNYILLFALGIFVALIALPLLSAIGVPSFDVILTAIFGEGNPWAAVFSILLIAVVLFVMNKAINRENQKVV